MTAPARDVDTYVLYCPGCRTIKNGHSSDVERRRDEIERDHLCHIRLHQDLQLLIVFEGYHEPDLDKRWAAAHISGDWFYYVDAIRRDLEAWGATDLPRVRVPRVVGWIWILFFWLEARRKKKAGGTP
jgi:hypothetical protein